jgi:glycosyltransferase involved in cell wall biosynthesis
MHPADFKIARAIRRYVRDNGPFDFIHGHSSKGGAMARFAAYGTNAAAYYTLHGLIMMDPGLRRWKKLMYLGIEHFLALRTQRIIAVSPEEQRAAVGLGLGKNRVELIPNGIAPLKLTSRTDARKELAVQDDEIVIGYVGRLVDQKAPHVLLGAFAIAAAKQPRLRLAMVGGGPLAEPMKELAASLGIADQVLWLGERDARGVLAAFDVFALSSRKEGLPYVILEASAVGLPVVATQAAGVELLVKPGYNGEVVPTDDTEAFGAALLAICSDDEKRVRYGRNALEHAKLFTADTMVEATLASYRSVYDRKLGVVSASA